MIQLLLLLIFEVQGAHPSLSASVEDVSATAARILWTMPSNMDEFQTIDNFVVTLKPIRVLREEAGSPTSNTIADCVVGEENLKGKRITVPNKSASATLIVADLTPFTLYEVQIQANDERNMEQLLNKLNFTTKESVPSKPRHLIVEKMDKATLLNVVWKTPLCDNGVRTQYSISYFPLNPDGTAGNSPKENNLFSETTHLTLTDLLPNTEYNVTLRAWTVNGPGEASSVIGRTNEDAPPPVTGLVFSSTEVLNSNSSVNVTVSWERPSDRNGHFEYQLTISGVQPGAYSDSDDITDDREVIVNDTGLKSTKHTFRALPGAQYTIQVLVVNSKRKLPSSMESITGSTVSKAPTAVRNTKAVPLNTEAIKVTWDKPEFPNGKILAYIVNFKQAADESDSFSMMQVQGGKLKDEKLIISGLDSFTFYTLFIQAVGVTGLVGPSAVWITQRTNSSALISVELKEDDIALEVTTDTIKFNLPSINFTTGPLKFFGIIVLLHSNDYLFMTAGPYKESALHYVAAAWDNYTDIPSQFTLGDGSITVVNKIPYLNAPLKRGKEYGIVLKVELSSDTEKPMVTFSNIVTVKTSLGLSLITKTLLTCAAVVIATFVTMLAYTRDCFKIRNNSESFTTWFGLCQERYEKFPLCSSVPEDKVHKVPEGHAGAFLARKKIWEGRTELKVHFLNADDLEKWGWKCRGEIMNITNVFSWARVWNFVQKQKIPSFILEAKPARADIRVKFANKGGNWSKVGTDAAIVGDLKQPTMQLNLNGLPPDLQESIVIHEFGHALGLEHEHQRSDFWKIIKKHLDEEKMRNDSRLAGLVDQWFPKKEFEGTSAYDPNSIMHYLFDIKWIKDKELHIRENIEKHTELGKKEKEYLLGIHQRFECHLQYTKRPSSGDFKALVEAYGGTFSSDMIDESYSLLN